jgi:DNA polymerase-3 subunit delta'
MVGQDDSVAALRHAVETGRLAHAYLLNGPRGVGRHTLARRLAQALACEVSDSRSEPCLECRACRHIEEGDWPDVERIAIGGVCDISEHRDHAADGSTRIRICQVRRVERVASLAPLRSARRVFIVDTAEELQPEAAHALLKTLEEPPASVVILLLATDLDGLLPTIRSRCQEIVLRPFAIPALAATLEQQLAIKAAEALNLARLARGRYGLAMQLHSDPSLRVLQESALDDLRTLLSATRNTRFDYAATLSGRWSKEREAVLAVLDFWSDWWSDRLQAAAGADVTAAAGPECSASDALRGLSATRRVRERLLENTNPQLALEVLMLDLPVLSIE